METRTHLELRSLQLPPLRSGAHDHRSRRPQYLPRSSHSCPRSAASSSPRNSDQSHRGSSSISELRPYRLAISDSVYQRLLADCAPSDELLYLEDDREQHQQKGKSAGKNSKLICATEKVAKAMKAFLRKFLSERSFSTHAQQLLDSDSIRLLQLRAGARAENEVKKTNKMV
jgi:hypothetical protein